TRGAYLVNANFTANMSNGKAAGVLMGAYHFAFPATNSPSTEANYFWAVAGPYILADGKTLMPMLDIESFTGIVGATSYSDWANQWYNNVIAKAAAAGVTIKPVLYSSASFMCNFNSSCSGFGSWVANYNGQNPQTGTPWSCCTSCNFWGGGAWNFWQYTSTGTIPGISGNVDHDISNGTTAQLSTWVATSAMVADIIIDNTSATVVGTWSTGTSSIDKYGADYRYKGQGTGSSYLKYTPNIVTPGNYNVYCWYPQGSNRGTDTPYVVTYNGATATVKVNQQTGGGRWNLLGTFNFTTGTGGNVKITDAVGNSSLLALADAVKFSYVR
ncbi:MAG: GH25 family lysozyme, partial [Limisphaerales bacterium]